MRSVILLLAFLAVKSHAELWTPPPIEADENHLPKSEIQKEEERPRKKLHSKKAKSHKTKGRGKSLLKADP